MESVNLMTQRNRADSSTRQRLLRLYETLTLCITDLPDNRTEISKNIKNSVKEIMKMVDMWIGKKSK